MAVEFGLRIPDERTGEISVLPVVNGLLPSETPQIVERNADGVHCMNFDVDVSPRSGVLLLLLVFYDQVLLFSTQGAAQSDGEPHPSMGQLSGMPTSDVGAWIVQSKEKLAAGRSNRLEWTAAPGNVVPGFTYPLPVEQTLIGLQAEGSAFRMVDISPNVMFVEEGTARKREVVVEGLQPGPVVFFELSGINHSRLLQASTTFLTQLRSIEGLTRFRVQQVEGP